MSAAKTHAIKKIRAVILTIMAAICLVLPLTITAAAQDAQSYYIVYESDNYRVRDPNALTKESDGTYTISPTLRRNDKFYVSDGKGSLWGNASGEPVTVTASLSARYTVTFDPVNVFADGSSIDGFTATDNTHIKFDYYAPSSFSLVQTVSGAPVKTGMEYRRNNAVFEEYVTTVDVSAGAVITVEGSDGVSYGRKGKDEEGITVTIGGKYRFAFTADSDNLYADNSYIQYSEAPELYLLCAQNNYTENPSFMLVRDESQTAYSEYKYASLNVAQNEGELTYRVYDKTNDIEYKPSENGKITVKDKGAYNVLYSPDRSYSGSGESAYHTTVERIDEHYDGYFALGDFNGYTYESGEEFAALYELKKDESVTSYDEYALTLYITDAMIAQYAQVGFCITDGATFYRKPNGDDIELDAAGEYEIVFSPTHDYGRGYRYRCSRVGDGAQSETVYINTAAQFKEFLANCTSPEYSLKKTFCLTVDIDLQGGEFTTARIFAGTFDGKFRTVKGIAVDSDGEDVSLIRELTADAILKDVTLEVNLKGARYSAPVRTNAGTVDNVIVKGSVEADSYAGGIVCNNASGATIKNSKNEAAVNAAMNAGGIAAFNAGAVENSTNSGAVNAKEYGANDESAMLNIGGVAGYSTGTVFGCLNTAAVGVGQGRYVGGIVGLCSGGLYFCENSGAVNGAQNVGGIVGYYGRFENTANNPLSQYLVGTQFEQWLDRYYGTNGTFEESADSGIREIYYCHNSANVWSENYVGGIAGHAGADSLEIVACVSSGNITARTSYSAGIVAELSAGSVTECVSYGEIVAQKGSYSAGIVASASGRVAYCQSSAYLEAAESYIGGIVASGTVVENCVSNVYITKGTGARFGAIAGAATGACTHNFYRTNEVGGIDGVSYGADSDYKAHALDEKDIVSQGTLSVALYGLDSAHWLAGENEARYPVPRAFTDIVDNGDYSYSDKAAFAAAFESAKIEEYAQESGKQVVIVTFYDYDFTAEKHETYSVFRVRKGDSLTAPEPPQEDGYFVWWDDVDLSGIESDAAVYLKYDRIMTSVASDDTTQPTVFVNGKFYSDTKLVLDYNGDYIMPIFYRGETRVTYTDLTVRYRLGKVNDYTVKLIKGADVIDAEITVSGDYAVFSLPEGYAFAAVKKTTNNTLWIVLAAVISAVAVALAFAIPLVVINVKKKKRRASSQDSDNEKAEGETNEATVNDETQDCHEDKEIIEEKIAQGSEENES